MFSKTSLSALLVVGLLLVGCQNDSNPTQPFNSDQLGYSSLSQLILPADAELQTAKLFVNVHAYGSTVPGMAVNVYAHRITAEWTEMGVTWGNFGAAYDPFVYGSFTVSGTGWTWVDVTALVQGWLDGDYPNYGILLDQEEMCWAHLTSREYGSAGSGDPAPAFLELSYTSGGGNVTDSIVTTADTYIWENNAVQNYGAMLYLKAGYDQVKEKQILLFCEVGQEPPDDPEDPEEPEDPDEDGCTQTIGYWANWSGLGSQPDMVTQYLPLWLGNAGGTASIMVADNVTAYAILSMEWDLPSNGIIMLYAQLLAAKLNFAAGADDSAVADEVVAADYFLGDYDWQDWDSLSEADQQMVLDWAAIFDDYNNGIIGPGHCED